MPGSQGLQQPPSSGFNQPPGMGGAPSGPGPVPSSQFGGFAPPSSQGMMPPPQPGGPFPGSQPGGFGQPGFNMQQPRAPGPSSQPQQPRRLDPEQMPSPVSVGWSWTVCMCVGILGGGFVFVFWF